MRFSIIVPVYNVADYLSKCVNSLLIQRCDSFEIILVDDGSTDGKCPALCDELAAAHPDLIRVYHQSNGGLGAARNTGLRHAEGEYVFFVDSDDTIEPNTLEVLNRRIDETHADMYIFSFRYLKENGYVNDLSETRLHHEIYLSDARKVEPAKRKTVIRHPIRKVN